MTDGGQLQEDVRREVIAGQEIDVFPRCYVDHGRVAANIAGLFCDYLEGKEQQALYRMDLIVGENDIFMPDVLICDPEMIQYDGIHGAPPLVVEVLTPGSILYDRGYKMEVYRRCGVREYWLVEFLRASKTVEQYLLEDGQFRLHAVYCKHPPAVLAKMPEEKRASLVTRFRCSLYEDLEISVDDIFKGMLFG